jgi:immunity protein 8 of polymorphic toxin system
MIRAELKRLHSPDVYDLSTYMPDDPEHFGVLVQVIAGPEGGDGEESFDVIVCTPSWLSNQIGPTEIKMGRHYLLLKQYDFARLMQFVSSFAAACTGATWEEAALRLGRLGKWEFEDYRA